MLPPVESAEEAQVVQRISDPAPGERLVEQPGSEPSGSEPSRAAGLVLEPSGVEVAQDEQWLPVVAAQESCPGSTKGRPENRSWIEFVRT